MTIRIFNGGHGREVNAGIIAEALLRGFTIHADYPFVWFDVPTWHAFCSLVYHVYCDFSRDSRGRQISQRVAVHVIMPNGAEYDTQVWCDVVGKCLRYVSLY